MTTRASPRGRTLTRDMARLFGDIAQRHEGRAWPSPRWQTDPVGFAATILGIELWSKQVAMVDLVREHLRVAITSGHKTGKSTALAVIALWFYACWPGARVIASAPTSRQVNKIVYREIRRLHAQSGVCLACRKRGESEGCDHSMPLPGEVHELAASGVKRTSDMAEIVGITATEAEAIAGISGANLLFLLDEASGISPRFFEVFEGNRAGGNVRIVLVSNPTQNVGEFFDAFHEKSEFYKTLEISSEETPNAVKGKDVIPGLASREWIEEKRREWGKDSPLYAVRVLGKFALAGEGQLFPVDIITRAEDAWLEAAVEGRLFVSCDPAGESGEGDESAFGVRRGLKVLRILARRGLTPDGHVAEVLGAIADHKREGEELPCVVVDRDGPVGARVWGAFLTYLQTKGEQPPFDLIGVRSGERAQRRPDVYGTTRDELWDSCAGWIRDGGAIPSDVKLAKELSMLRWEKLVAGKAKLIAKEEIRKLIGRSPDRADALALVCWRPQMLGATGVQEARQEQRERLNAFESPAEQVFDPYAGVDPYSGTIDPYGGKRR